MAKGYTTKAKVAQFLNTTISMSDDDFAVLIAYAESIIEQITGRIFAVVLTDEEELEDVAEVRLFSGNGRQSLLIDDTCLVTKVEVGNDDYGGSFTEVDPVSENPDGYFLLPPNALSKGQPITEIKLRSRHWTCGELNNRITAVWAYSEEAPDDISFAATVLTGGIYNYNRGGGSGNIKSERIGDYSVTYDNDGGWDDLERAKDIIKTRTKMII